MPIDFEEDVSPTIDFIPDADLERESKREELRSQTREAKAEAIGNKAISGLANIGERIAYTAALLGAKADPTGVVHNMLVREGYEVPTVIPPQAIEQDIRTVGEFGREALGNLGIRPGPIAPEIERPLTEFAAENIAGLAEAAPQLTLGKFQPRPVARYFQGQMAAGLQPAIEQAVQAETPEEKLKAGLQLGANVAFPAAIELGLRQKFQPVPLPRDIPGSTLRMPEGARPTAESLLLQKLREEGLKEQSARDLISGKKNPEQVVDETLPAIVQPKTPTQGHDEAYDQARDQAKARIEAVMNGEDPNAIGEPVTIPDVGRSLEIKAIASETGVPEETVAKGENIERRDHPKVAEEHPELIAELTKNELDIDKAAYDKDKDPGTESPYSYGLKEEKPIGDIGEMTDYEKSLRQSLASFDKPFHPEWKETNPAGFIQEEISRLQRKQSILEELGRIPRSLESIRNWTRKEVESAWHEGRITDKLFYEYAKEWNKTPRFGNKMREGPLPSEPPPEPVPPAAPTEVTKEATIARDITDIATSKPWNLGYSVVMPEVEAQFYFPNASKAKEVLGRVTKGEVIETLGDLFSDVADRVGKVLKTGQKGFKAYYNKPSEIEAGRSVKLDLKNPMLVREPYGYGFDESDLMALVRTAIQQGHDGLVILNESALPKDVLNKVDKIFEHPKYGTLEQLDDQIESLKWNNLKRVDWENGEHTIVTFDRTLESEPKSVAEELSGISPDHALDLYNSGKITKQQLDSVLSEPKLTQPPAPPAVSETKPSVKQPKITVEDLSSQKAAGGYSPFTGKVSLDKESVSKMTPEERASVVRHELAHKIETESELWQKSDDFLWRLWESDRNHPIWDLMGEVTGRWKFGNDLSPEIVAALYADHYPKGTFTVKERPITYEWEGEDWVGPKEYPIPPELMSVLDQIESELGIWKKKQKRGSVNQPSPPTSARQEVSKASAEGIDLESAKRKFSEASQKLAKARLTYIIGEPREKFANAPASKRKIMQQYWDAKDELDRATPPAGEPQPPQIGSGPGAMTATEPPKAQIEQLTDAFKGIEAEKVPLKDQVKEAFAVGEKFSGTKDLFSRALSGLKSSGDWIIQKWKAIPDIDNLLRAKGDLSAQLQANSWRTQKWIKQALKAIPRKRDQAAIAKWIDAGGDRAELERGFRETKPEFKQAYLDALNLKGDLLVAARNAQNYFESRLQEAVDAGVLKDGVEDYIHRIYESRPDVAEKAIAHVQDGILKANPALAKKRVFQFDWEAEKLGYKPVQSFITRLAVYESSLAKALAAREFIRKATTMKAADGRPIVDVKGVGIPLEDAATGERTGTLIKPQFNPAKANVEGTANYRGDYVNKEFPALSKWKWVSEDAAGKPILVQGDVAIHPDYVHRINALLEPSRVRYGRYGKVLKPAMAISSTVKQTMLDLSMFHQVQITVHGLEHKVLPWKILQDIDLDNPNVQGLLKGGISLGGEYSPYHAEGLVGASLTRHIPFLGPLTESYHNWLFQSYIPRIKMTMALDALERNRARYKGELTEEQILHKTARQANSAFGELNYVMLERSKTAQDIARLIMLAPDFLEARGRFAAEALTKGGKSTVPGFGNEQRAALLLGALTLYVTARMANKMINDQYHFEPENAFSIVKDGHTYSLRTVQGDILHLLAKPLQFWMNRLNPVYGRTLLQIATGRDYFGRKRSVPETLWDSVANTMPIALRSSRERALWESIANSMGVQAKRWSDVDDAFTLAKKWKDARGIGEKGEFIYDPDKDPLRPLKIALSHGDDAGAAKEIGKLTEGGTKIKKLNDYFDRYASMPFTGSAANDRKWQKELSEDEKKTVLAAREHKKSIKQLYLKARGQYFAAKNNPK